MILTRRGDPDPRRVSVSVPKVVSTTRAIKRLRGGRRREDPAPQSGPSSEPPAEYFRHTGRVVCGRRSLSTFSYCPAGSGMCPLLVHQGRLVTLCRLRLPRPTLRVHRNSSHYLPPFLRPSGFSRTPGPGASSDTWVSTKPDLFRVRTSTQTTGPPVHCR